MTALLLRPGFLSPLSGPRLPSLLSGRGIVLCRRVEAKHELLALGNRPLF
jgi:hypothetical protein